MSFTTKNVSLNKRVFSSAEPTSVKKSCQQTRKRVKFFVKQHEVLWWKVHNCVKRFCKNTSEKRFRSDCRVKHGTSTEKLAEPIGRKLWVVIFQNLASSRKSGPKNFCSGGCKKSFSRSFNFSQFSHHYQHD